MPSPRPAPAIASVTSARRPPATRHSRRTISGSRWTPSTIAWTITSGRMSAAPTMPGSRWASGRIALKTCVTVRTPRSKAACAWAAVASLCPSETVTPRACRSSIRSSAPGSSGASVISRTGPAASRRSSSAGSGSCRERESVRAEARGGEERALEVDTEDARASGCRRNRPQRRDEVVLGRGDQRRQVGGDAGLEQRRLQPLRSRRRRRRGSRRRRSRSPGGRRSRARRSRLPFARSSPTAATRPSSTATSPGTRRPSTSAASTPSLMGRAPFARRRRLAPVARARRRRRRRRGARRSRPSRRRRPRRGPRRRRRPRRRSRDATMRRTRARSLSFVATTSTIRFPNVLPSRTIATVEIMLRTSFWAVPALSRVEPAITSLPTTTAISCSASRRELRLRRRRRVRRSARRGGAPHRARRRAYGVRPLALTPTTASAGPTSSAADRREHRHRGRPRPAPVPRPRSRLHRRRAPGPDRRGDRTSTRTRRRRRARAAPMCPRRRRQAFRRSRAVRRSRRSRATRDGCARATACGNGRILLVHRRDERVRRAKVEVAAGRVPGLGDEAVELCVLACRPPRVPVYARRGRVVKTNVSRCDIKWSCSSRFTSSREGAVAMATIEPRSRHEGLRKRVSGGRRRVPRGG